MAKQDDWGSIFDDAPGSVPVDPTQDPSSDWGSIFDKDNSYVQPVIPEKPDVPNSQRQGWGSFEPGGAIKEGTKQVGSMFQSAMAAPEKAMTAIGKRIAGVPQQGIDIDQYELTEAQRKEIKNINKINDIVQTVGSATSPSKIFLGVLKVAGLLEPDMDFYRRQEDKKDEVQVAEQFLAVGPQMVVNIFAGLAGGKAGVMTSSFMQIYGGSFEKHRQNHPDDEAAALAMVDAIPQAAVESLSTIFMLGGLKAFQPMMKGKVISKLAKTLNSKPISWLKKQADTVSGRIIGSIATEGAEEYAQSHLEIIADVISHKMRGGEITEKYLKDLMAEKHKEGKRAALIGALWGGAAGGPMAIIDKKMNPLGVNPEVNPDQANVPENIENKTDARQLLNGAIEDYYREPEVPDVPAPGAIPETQEQIGGFAGMAAVAEAAAAEPVVDDEVADIITDPTEPKIQEQKDIKDMSLEQYRLVYRTQPEARPEWGSTDPGFAQPQTDLEMMANRQLEEEADRAYAQSRGEDVIAESTAVNRVRSYFNDPKIDAEATYGKDFMRQMPHSELNPMQKLWKQIVRQMYGRSVHFVEFSDKVKEDPYGPLSNRAGVREPVTGSIVIFNQASTMNQAGTIFHEITHDMAKVAPQIWKPLASFLKKEGVNVKDAASRISTLYGEDGKPADADLTTDELVAKFVGDIMKGEKAQVSLLKKLRLQEPTVFNQLMTYVRNALKKLSMYVKRIDTKESDIILKDIDKAIDFITTTLAKYQSIGGKKPYAAGRTKKQAIQITKAGFQFDLKKEKRDDVKWFSAMNKYLESALPGKGSGRQLSTLINKWVQKGNFKKEELEWSGLIDWLAEQKEVITKKEIMDYLKENEVSVDEVKRVEYTSKTEITDIPEAYDTMIRLSTDAQNLFKKAVGNDGEWLLERSPDPVTGQMIYEGFRDENDWTFVSFSEAADIADSNLSPPDFQEYLDTVESLVEYDEDVRQAELERDPDRVFADTQSAIRMYMDDLAAEGWSPIYENNEQGVTQIVSVYRGSGEERFVGDERFAEDDPQIKRKVDLLNGLHKREAMLRKMPARIKAKYGPAETDRLTIGGMGEGKYEELLITLPKVTPKWQHQHFKDTDNVLAIVRYDFRMVEGKKVLLIQELQSDWHQAGAKRGYRTKISKPVYYVERADTGSVVSEYFDTIEEAEEFKENAGNEYGVIKVVSDSMSQGNRVPDAPYKKTWTDLAMRRMTKMAAANDVDYIAWVTGDIVQQRYDLSNVIAEVRYSPFSDTLYAYDHRESMVLEEEVEPSVENFEPYMGQEIAEKLYAKFEDFKYGTKEYDIVLDEDGEAWNIYDPNGELMYDRGGYPLKFESREDAEEELNYRFREDERRFHNISVRGLELKAGGEWAENLYDKKLKNRWNSMFGKKKWGSPKVFKGEVPVSDEAEDAEKVWMAPITKKMKDSIPDQLEPQFSLTEKPAAGKGEKAALNMINNLSKGIDSVRIDPNDHGTQAIAESIGFVKNGDVYTFDERIPKDADIIAGMYQASWNINLKSKRTSKNLLDKISKQFNQEKGKRLGDAEQKGRGEKLQRYLNESWVTYTAGQSGTSMGDFKGTKNILVRPKGIESGKGRQLMVQITSNYAKEEATSMGDSYFDALYTYRDGYFRPDDFWELPEWMGRVAKFAPDADVYVARNIEEAKQFIAQSGYDKVLFSAMDNNKEMIKAISDTIPKKAIISGYTDPGYFKGSGKWVNTLEEAAGILGLKFAAGVDYRHFVGTKTIPRLEMSKGCRHNCAFCVVQKELESATDAQIDEQLENFKKLGYKLIYLNDKTFGQADNYEKLVDINEKVKASNPEFDGFIIQTTAPQFLKMPTDFLQKSGIKYVELGCESYNDDILKKVNKPHNTDLIDKAVEKIRALNMRFIPNIMVGLAGSEVDPTPATKTNVWLRGSNRGKLAMDPKEKRGALYFTKDKYYAMEYGKRVDSYEINVKKTWDSSDPKTMDQDIIRMMEKHPEFPHDETDGVMVIEDGVEVPYGMYTDAEKYGDWAVLEDPKIRKALKSKGYDSYMTTEGGGSIGVFDRNNVKEYDPKRIWTETAKTYGNTLNFLKKHGDIISHVNVYVLATYEGTKLHEQIGTDLETDSDQGVLDKSWLDVNIDENTVEKSWLKNQKIHEKFYADVLQFGTDQLTMQESKISDLQALQQLAPRGIRVDAIGEEDTTLPPGMIQVTDHRGDAETFGASFSVSIGTGDEIAAQIAEKHDEFIKLKKAAKGISGYLTPQFELLAPADDKNSEAFRKAYYGIFDISKKARGLKKVGAWLKKQKTLNGLPLTKTLRGHITKHAESLAKDPAKAKRLKQIIAHRDGIASGKLNPTDPKVVKKGKKLGSIKPYTIKHTGKNFYIGKRMRYGQFVESEALFDDDREIAKEREIEYVDPITGIPQKLKKYYDKDGNRLIKGPVFSADRDTRIKEIKKIVKKNARFSDWYERWRRFMFQFKDKGVSEIKIKRIAAISGLLGTGKSPQTQQNIWADTINKLEAGRRIHKVAKNDLVKVNDIWEGKKDDVLSRTDDEGIALIQKEFGRKIGPYLAASIDPSSPNVLVLDRHMPKGWGYNVLATTESPQGGWNMHPSVEEEIKRDIFQVADETGVTVAGVQAALWFDFRTPATDVSDIVNIAQIEPGRYVPYVFHKRTFPEQTLGIHYKKTPIPEGEFVLGSTPDGKAKYNTYSRTDIGERISAATKNWPYEPMVYMYQPGGAQESQIVGGRRAYTFKFNPNEIYDGFNDPYDYWGKAREEHAKEPFASLSNIFFNLIRKREQYKGVIIRSPYGNNDPWMMIFEKAAVEDFPEVTQIGISDMIEGDTEYKGFEQAVKDMGIRSAMFTKFAKKSRGLRRYEELKIERDYPSVAKFEGVTSGPGIEISTAMKLDGPLRSQRAYLSEMAIARAQNVVYLVHGKRADVNYPVYIDVTDATLFKFKADTKYHDDPETGESKIPILAKDLEAAGLKEFNIVRSPAGWPIIEQLTFNDKDAVQMADIMEKFAEKGFPHNEVSEVHSETIGAYDGSTDHYESAIKEYWGETKGQEVIDNAKERREKFIESVRSGAYQKKIAPEKLPKDKGKRKPGDDEGGLDLQEQLDDDTQDLVDRIGRNPVSLIDKLKAKANYKKGRFAQGMVDKLHALKMYAGAKSKAYMLHRGLPGVQSSINALMEHGKLILDDSMVLTTKTKGEGFIPWLRGLGKDGDKFWYWLIVNRDQAREKRDKKYIPMFTKDERAKLLNWTGTKSPDGKPWVKVNKEFQEFNKSVLDIAVKSGLLDPAMVAQFKDQFYVPFYRIFEDAESTAEFIKAPVNTKRIIAAQIKKLKGSKRQMGDPLENILANWSHLLKQSMANLSRKEAFTALNENNVLSENGEPVVEEVPWKDTVIFKSGGKRRNELGGADTVTFIYQKEGVEVLGFKDNGKTRFFKVNDPELFQSLAMQPGNRLPGWLSAILGVPKALLTFGATITPSFVVANATRDTLHTYSISKGFIPFWDTARGFIKTLRKDQDFVEYMASGNAFVGSYVKADRPENFGKYTKKLIKREGRGVVGRILDSPTKLWNLWTSITEASENATRLALYSKRRAEGKTILEASFEARDILDFQKSGANEVVGYLIQTVPFLNARMQGLHKMGEAVMENPKMYMLKGATIAAASIALWAAYRDDDRYKELEDWEKFAYYHFWIGDKHFRIPKPFETGVLWSSAWTAAADVMTGGEEASHLTEFIGASLLDTFAFNPIPQAARPILEQYFNKNFFTGRAIVPEGFKYRNPEDRFYPWDSESAQILGKMLGVSPRRIQSLVRGYLAGLGLGIMAGTDMIARYFGDFPVRPSSDIDSMPMIGRFVRSTPAKYTKYQSKFYDIFQDLNELNQTINIAMRDGRYMEAQELRQANLKNIQAFGKGKNVKRDLARIRKEVLAIWKNKRMSADMKREKLKAQMEKRNKAVKDFYDWWLKNK